DNIEVKIDSHQENIAKVLSYLFGCPFGRWDIRYPTGERRPPQLPSDPFAPLPACPPGMLQSATGMPAAPEDVPIDYPIHISWSGILVDDDRLSEDITRRVGESLCVIWPGRWEAIESEACEILGVRSLREYLHRNFFADHLKRYSKSRRQAPIYWPLSTPSGSYTLWLYYHRLTDQTLFTCVNDFVSPKLKQVGEDAQWLRQKLRRTTAEEKELERLADFEAELHDFQAELLRVAGFWKPDLNDGVEITAAPLWRLFQHRPWQKRLKETWEKLERGDYDWAHLAYSIWPERVREKCKSDKSLAIAHGLEDLYVEPPASGKKKGRKKAAEVEMEEMFDG
ncbi:MAG: SAM-dependent methyltransferase, partial [Chloroflexota bacterium]